MSKKGLFWILFCLIVFTLSVVAYSILSGGRDDNSGIVEKEYLQVIPDGSTILAKVNIGNLLDKSSAFENETVRKNLDIMRVLLGKELSMVLDKIVEEPSNCGIDIKEPIVLALMDASGKKGIVTMAVKSKKNLADYLNVVMKEMGFCLQEENSIYRIQDPNSEVLKPFAFDSDKLVFAFAADGVAEALDYMSVSDLPKAVENECYSRFFAAEEDIVVYLKGTACLPLLDLELRNDTTVTSVLESTDAYATADFKNGEFVADIDIDTREDIKTLLCSLLKLGCGKHSAFVPDNAWLVANLSLDFRALEQTLSNVFNFDALLQLYGIERTLVDALSTECTFALMPVENNSRQGIPRFVFVADCSKEAFDCIVEKCMLLNGFSKVSDNVYSLGLNRYAGTYNGVKRQDGNDSYLLYQNGLLMIMPVDVYKSQLRSNGLLSSMLDNRLLAAYKDAAVVLDANAFMEELCKMTAVGKDETLYYVVKNDIDAVTLTLESMLRATFEVSFAEKDENALKTIFDKLMQYYNDKIIMP